jgi:hypothetical protein
MSRIEGPSRGQPPAKPDRAGAGKPEEGEFDRVLEEREGEAPDTGATTATQGTARRGAAGGPASRTAGKGPGEGGGQPKEQGGEGTAAATGGTATGRLARTAGGPRGGLVPGSAGQAGATARLAGIPAGGQPGAGEAPLPGGTVPNLPPGPGLGRATATGASGEDAAALGEGNAALAAAREAGAGGAEGGLEPAPETELELAPETLPAGAAPGAAAAAPAIGPAAPSEAAPPAPASDPALVRQVAQQVLAGIEVHLVAGRTQVELGLDLGALGQARVDLARGSGGALQVTFRLDTTEAQLAVARNLPELASALEQKGYAPTIELRGGDGSALGGEAGRERERQAGAGREQGQGRSRGQYLPPAEEER